MSVREVLNKRPSVAAGVAVGAIVIAGFFWATSQTRNLAPSSLPSQVWYSDDDGQTTFPATSDKIGPFSNNGKIAVMAHVFDCGGKPVTGYLERAINLSAIPEINAARQRIVAATTTRPSVDTTDPDHRFVVDHLEVKRPGPGKWVRLTDPAAGKIVTFVCPGEGEPASELFPK